MALTWHILFVAGIILIVLEVFLPWMILFPLGLASIMTAPISVFTDQLWVDGLFFVFFSACNLVLLRMWVGLKRAARAPDSGLDYLIGKEALVVQAIDPKRRVGSVRYQNENWRAISQMRETLSAGTKVVIMNVADNRVIVLPKSD